MWLLTLVGLLLLAACQRTAPATTTSVDTSGEPTAVAQDQVAAVPATATAPAPTATPETAATTAPPEATDALTEEATATATATPEINLTATRIAAAAATLAANGITQNIEIDARDVDSEIQSFASLTPAPTRTPNTPMLVALEDAALYSAAGGGDGRTGYYVPKDQQAWVFGRSEDRRWLHVRTRIAGEGWVRATYVQLIDVDLIDLPVSNYQTTADPNVTPVFVPSPTPTGQPGIIAARPPAQATSWPTRTPTPWPTRAVWPTATPQRRTWPTATPPRRVWPTATPARTPLPTRPQQLAPQPTATPPRITARPTPRPGGGPTPTPTGIWPTPTAIWLIPTSPAGNNGAPPAQTGAIAWWHEVDGTRQATGNGRWTVTVSVRVPTAFQYLFEAEYLTATELVQRNNDGDDYFELRLAGMACGANYNSPLIVRQNGSVMMVFNDYTLLQSTMTINAPC